MIVEYKERCTVALKDVNPGDVFMLEASSDIFMRTSASANCKLYAVNLKTGCMNLFSTDLNVVMIKCKLQIDLA